MSSTVSYRNPILPGFNPDPSAIRVGDDYFLATSTFEYFPAVPIYTSKNLIDWELVGHALNRRSQLDIRSVQPGLGICAPTLRHHNGRFYMATCALWKLHGRPGEPMVPPRGFYVWTDNIWDASSWSEPIYFDVIGIDQDLFWDDDGQVYLSVAKPILPFTTGFRMGVYSCAVDLKTGRSLTPLVLQRQTHLTKDEVAEGSHIFKKDGIYYLHTAEGGTQTAHQQWIMRSSVGPLGPWEVAPPPINPLVYNDEQQDIRQTGHMDLFEGHDGKWWAVFLAVRDPKYANGERCLSHLGRETFLAPVEWKDGWPIVNENKPISIHGLETASLSRSLPRIEKNFEFSPDKSIYCDGWYHLRTPVKIEYDLSLRPGSIAIFGNPVPLRADEAVTMLLQKQTSFTGVWRVTVDFQPYAEGLEAGTAVWWSKWSFASLSIVGKKLSDGLIGRELIFRHSDPEGDSEAIIETCTPIGFSGPIHFTVEAETDSYRFSYSQSLDDRAMEVGTFPARLLVRNREFDSIMTGTHFALFALGAGGQSSLVPAFFSDVSWNGTKEGGL